MLRGVIELIADLADLRRHLQWAIEEFWDGGIDVLRPRRAPRRALPMLHRRAGPLLL